MGAKTDNRERLTDVQVVQLREDYARLCAGLEPGEPVNEVEEYLADKYGVTMMTVGNITSGKSRRSVGGTLTPRPKVRKTAEKIGFTAGVEITIKDEAGRVVHTYTAPEGHTISTRTVITQVVHSV